LSAESLETRAEILKLARLLGCEPEEMHYLEAVGLADLRILREQVTEVLFDSHLAVLKRLAAASRLLPVALVAQLGERVFGPLLAARITGLLDPGRAVELAAKLPVGFLADVAIELDPRRATDVICRIPAEQISAITGELVDRGEYVTMGRFVGCLPDASITAALDRLDPSSLLEVALVLEGKDGLEHLLDLLGPERFQEMIVTAEEAGLGGDALELLDFLPEPRRRAILEMPALQRRLRAQGVSAPPERAPGRRGPRTATG
jgi:hypothetical protein